jgi:hypothetical protein
MIEPVIDALTTSKRPARIATRAMINSAALPKVAFSRPPTPSPALAAKRSVALPMRPASGTIASAAAGNIAEDSMGELENDGDRDHDQQPVRQIAWGEQISKL